MPPTSELRAATFVTLLYTVLTVVLAYPVSLRPDTILLADNPDTHLFLWTLAWDVHAFVNQPFAIFDANIFHPLSGTLAYSENLLGSALLAAPVIWLTGNVVLALNLVQLATCVLCGLGAYLLARRLGIGRSGAILCGLIFLAAPPRFFRIGQLHLTAVQWLPFALACLHTYLETGRRRTLLAALAFSTLQALTSGHGAVFLIVAVSVVLVGRIATGHRVALWKVAKDAGLAGALIVAPIAALAVPYRSAQREAGLIRSLENWLPTPASYLASPSHGHRHLRSLLPELNFADDASAWLFPGITVVILTIAALVPRLQPQSPTGERRWWPGPNPTLTYAALLLVALLMFMPPPIGLWPWVYSWPGFNFIRVPSRFMILAMLALAVLAGLGFDRLVFGRKPVVRRVAAVGLAAVLLLEYASMPLAYTPYAITVPPIDRWLNGQPKPFAVAEVPMPSQGDLGAYERHNTMAMLHATAHWQRTVHGYSGIRPALHERLYRELTVFPDPVSLATLRELGVTYVVVHDELYSPEGREAAALRFRTFAAHLQLERVEGEGRVYRILAAPAQLIP